MRPFDFPSRRPGVSVNGQAAAAAPPVPIDAAADDAWIDVVHRRRWRVLLALHAVTLAAIGVAVWYLSHRLDVLATYIILGRK